MEKMEQGVVRGLEGVLVAATKLSDVDGEAGRLVLAGHRVEDLAPTCSFEAIVALFADGELPSPARESAVKQALAAARVAAFERLPRAALELEDGMASLRASLATLEAPNGANADFALIGATAVFAAAWFARREKREPVAPDAARSHADDFLHMARGASATAAEIRAIETYLATVVDHGMNASTFTARVVASTGSDSVSAIVAGLGSLKGPLHGGAPGPVLDMLDAIGSADNAAAFVAAELDAGRRIMGMGHRVYRVRDPRADVLEKALTRLADGAPTPRLALAKAVERAAEEELRKRHPDRPLPANVEFYTAVLLEAVGLDRSLFSLVFAVSRVVGWCAHVREERLVGRLIRPSSRYVGPAPQPL